jgi:hypothetical protein
MFNFIDCATTDFDLYCEPRRSVKLTAMYDATVFAISLHVLIKISASLGFLLAPSKTLQRPQPYAHPDDPVIRQYGPLLLVTNVMLVALLFELYSDNNTLSSLTLHTCGALALYHPAPIWRALGRLTRDGHPHSLMASPSLHLCLHGACLSTAIFASAYSPSNDWNVA